MKAACFPLTQQSDLHAGQRECSSFSHWETTDEGLPWQYSTHRAGFTGNLFCMSFCTLYGINKKNGGKKVSGAFLEHTHMNQSLQTTCKAKLNLVSASKSGEHGLG